MYYFRRMIEHGTKPAKRQRAFVSLARTSISMPEMILRLGSERQRQTGYSSFSDYVQALIRRDAKLETAV